MINFFSENGYVLQQQDSIRNWISSIISSEAYEEGNIDFVFCDDSFLLELNVQFLNHDTLTDVISFDNSLDREVNGEIYISTERVEENANKYSVSVEEELLRVMAHGILHLCGYNDKTAEESALMRLKEDHYLVIYKNPSS